METQAGVKYEYKVLWHGREFGDSAKYEDKLNQLGAAGWFPLPKTDLPYAEHCVVFYRVEPNVQYGNCGHYPMDIGDTVSTVDGKYYRLTSYSQPISWEQAKLALHEVEVALGVQVDIPVPGWELVEGKPPSGMVLGNASFIRV